MPPKALFDVKTLDCNRIIVTKQEIEKFNPQRFEMQQLDAIVFLDRNQHLIVGYKDVRPDEFWVRGHMPDFPLMPGVIICEAAAQITSYYWRSSGTVGGDFVAFGGMDEVRFRDAVHVGDRLVLVAKSRKWDRRKIETECQGFVGETMVFHGIMMGLPFHKPKEGGP